MGASAYFGIIPSRLTYDNNICFNEVAPNALLALHIDALILP